MKWSVLKVPKRTGTYADTLEFLGLCEIINNIILQAGIGEAGLNPKVELNLKDEGFCYTLYINPALREEQINNITNIKLFPYIAKNKKECDEAKSKGLDYLDYMEQQELRQKYTEVKKTFKGKQLPDELADMKPHLNYDIFAAINYLKGTTSNNKLLEFINEVKDIPDFIKKLLNIYTELNDMDQREQAFNKCYKLSISALQLWNPSEGKGVSQLKANGIGVTSNKSTLNRELLKYIGIYKCVYFKAPSGSKDRKAWVLIPKQIDLDNFTKIHFKFKNKFEFLGGGSVKLDLLGILILLQSILDHLEIAKVAEDFFKLQPAAYISGFHTAFFKNLGTSNAVTNISYLHIPAWVSIQTEQELNMFYDIIIEIEERLKAMDDKKSEVIAMLQDFRRFISDGVLDDYLQFMIAYAGYVSKAVENGEYYVKPFTTNNFIEVVKAVEKKDKKYSDIIENEGFKRVAEAIRKSTISLQYQKKPLYEVKYGLAMDIKRKASFKDDLIAYLSSFIANYNNENARIFEKKNKQFRKNVRTTDFEAVVKLVDDFDSDVIGKMLAAYGYCSDPKEETAGNDVKEEIV